MKYLKTHFLKYIQKGSVDNHDPVLLIYDGHASHVNLDLMKWAIEHNIILFVYPIMPHMLFIPLMLVVLHLSKFAITANVT